MQLNQIAALVIVSGTLVAPVLAGKSTSSRTRVEVNRRGDLNGDGRVNLEDIAAFARLSAVSAPEADVDRNGRIEPRDSTALSQLAADFKAADINRDGKLDIADLQLFYVLRTRSLVATPLLDVNRDGRVDIADNSQIALILYDQQPI